MKKLKILKFLIPCAIILFGIFKTDIFARMIRPDLTAYAVGDITIDWGVLPGKPIFYVLNIMPGDEEKRTVKITNGSLNTRIIGVQGIKTNFPGFLANVLEITISQNGTDIYGGTKGTKTLSQFFMESLFLNSLKLFTLNPGESKTITFKVKFKNSAGNLYQKTKVVFDLKIGYYKTENTGCGGIPSCNPCSFYFPKQCFFTR